MKPELLISKAFARKGILPAEETLQLARYASAMRDFGSTMLAAYLAAEDYALRGGSKEVAADKLDKADTAIEEWAEALYGEAWRELGVTPDSASTPRAASAARAS